MRKLLLTPRLILCTLLLQIFIADSLSAQSIFSYASQKTTVNNYSDNESAQKQKLFNVLKELNKEKGAYFLFSDESFGSKMVSPVDETKASVEQILDDILKNTGLTYKKISTNIYVIVSVKSKNETSALNKADAAELINIQIPADEKMSLIQIASETFSIITGHVISKDGQALPGVSVTKKGTTKGTVTDAAGTFRIDANKGDVLVFSYVGFVNQEITVGNDNTFNVTLLEGQQQLNEVVVTALGIQRQAKSLTYATQKVSNSDLTTVKDASFINSLTGKIAGVTIARSSSGIGGSTRVTIRGNKSTRNNQPLYVVDGVPLINPSPAQPGDEFGQSLGFVGVDGGDGIANINPDDIESINVLKGASAAALYGSSAANGVILITTKKGKAGTPKIQFSSEETFDNPLYQEPLQFKYGQTSPATPGKFGSMDSWGGIVNAPNHVKSFFQTGVTAFNSISLSGGTDKSQTYFSYSYLDNKGMMPETKLQKHNINFHQTNKFFNDRLTSDLNVLFINQKAVNRPVSGLYDNPLIGLYMFPRGLNFNQYKQYEVSSTLRNTNVQNWWNANADSGWAGDPGNQNPYWLLNRNKSTNTINRVFTNFSLNYKIYNWLNFQARGNIDKSYNDVDLKSYATTNNVVTPPNGSYFLINAINTQLYGDLLLTMNKQVTRDLTLNATVGSSINDARLNKSTFGTNQSGDGLRYANVFNLINILPGNFSIAQDIQHQQTQAVFGTTSLGFKNYLFLDLTGRNDWSSTLAYTPSEKNGFFYYSAGINDVISDMIKMPDGISFAKVRASYAKVGNAVDIFKSNPPAFTNDNQNGVNAQTKGVYPGTYLKPEDNRSFEAGTEWRFINNRVGFDFTYYINNNKDQYIEVGAPAASGLQSYYLNAGNIRNKGVELSVFASPLKSSLIQWTTTINFAQNRNKVISLTNDALNVTANSFQLTGIGNLLYASYLVKGGSYGDIYGKYFARSADGAIIVDSSGAPQKGSNDSAIIDKNLKYLGNPNPKYTIGWNNTVTIKNVSIDFLFDGRFGGKVMSVTQAVLDEFGYSKASADARDAGGIAINAEKADGSKFTGKIDAKTFYEGVGGQDGIGEYYIYNATNIRLRELAVGYQFIFKKKSTINSLKISAIGRNLFFIKKDAPFDPELSMATNNGLQGTVTFALPTARSFGFSINAGF